jgi:hypothetical protein
MKEVKKQYIIKEIHKIKMSVLYNKIIKKEKPKDNGSK